MKNRITSSTKILAISIAAFVVVSMAACAQKPVLKQVDDGADERPLNTPEQVETIKQKHSK